MKVEFNIKLIEDYIQNNKLSKKEFCKQCCIGEPILRKILKNQQNFRLSALFKIARELNINVHELFIRIK